MTAVVDAISNVADIVSAGATLASTTIDIISASGGIRNAAFEISNHLNVPLLAGDAYVHSGCNRVSLQPVIRPKTKEAAQYDHIWNTATGTSGIISFVVNDDNDPMAFAITWSVPFDYNWYSNWFGMTVIPKWKAKSIGKTFYDELYNDPAWKSPKQDKIFGYARDARAIAIFHNDYIVSATMTDVGRTHIKVDVEKQAGGHAKNRYRFNL